MLCMYMATTLSSWQLYSSQACCKCHLCLSSFAPSAWSGKALFHIVHIFRCPCFASRTLGPNSSSKNWVSLMALVSFLRSTAFLQMLLQILFLGFLEESKVDGSPTIKVLRVRRTRAGIISFSCLETPNSPLLYRAIAVQFTTLVNIKTCQISFKFKTQIVGLRADPTFSSCLLSITSHITFKTTHITFKTNFPALMSIAQFALWTHRTRLNTLQQLTKMSWYANCATIIILPVFWGICWKANIIKSETNT